MSKTLLKSWLFNPGCVAIAILLASTANAAELLQKKDLVTTDSKNLFAQALSSDSDNTSNSQLLNQIETYGQEGQNNSLNQVTNVNQLRDVSPSDWAYEALRSLVDRYGCIVGYPNQTFRGNQPLSRYEFAAGLNACLNQIERLIASSEAVVREDLETLQRLMQEFEAELATLGSRVDNLESRTAFLEDHQFSTTTKLEGEVIFGLTDSFGEDDESQTVLGDRFRLSFNTSFTGKDKLVTRLAGGNLDQLFGPTSTQTFNIATNGNAGDNDNDVEVDKLTYSFPFELGNTQLDTYVAAFGGIHSDYVPTLNPYFEDFDGGNGALSTFASESPIYRIGSGAGAAVSFKFSALESILGPSTITVGYLAGDADNPSEGSGLFNGDYSALAQINFALSDRLNLGATYVRGYNQGTSTFNNLVGTTVANLEGVTKTTNTFGAEATWRITDGININSFFAYQDVNAKDDSGIDGDVWTWGAGVAFPDFGKEGNVLGLFAGVQPYLGDAANNELPIHVEAFYKYQLNDNISITPGVIWVANPEQGIGNDQDRFIGTIRTTFTF
jgi:hypothetical protein